jgi:DNA-binding NarL/FixJ family response regulator
MTLAAAVDHALGRRWAPPDQAPDRRPPLTQTELSVARLVAQGFTNRQIALRLGASQRSVESHLAQIRTKLSLRSRAHVASWAAEACLR